MTSRGLSVQHIILHNEHKQYQKQQQQSINKIVKISPKPNIKFPSHEKQSLS